MIRTTLRLALAMVTLVAPGALVACGGAPGDDASSSVDEAAARHDKHKDAGADAATIDAAPSSPDAGTSTPPDSGSGSGGGGGGATLHYSANIGGAIASAQALGFDVMDVAGSTTNPANTRARVDGLPAGMRALVWVGNLDNTNCATPGFTLAQFEALVDALAGDARVLGYYVSDEPHPNTCTTAATDIRTRADYIHAHAPGQLAFIVVVDGSNNCGATNLGCEYAAMAPASTHVDLVGLDPYPCHYDTSGNAVPCDDGAIVTKVNLAVSKGIPVSAIVPVFDTFGQENRLDGKAVYYRTPSASELTSMLATWAQLAPSPVFDYAYTYGVQCTTTTCPAPQAIANHPELQSVVLAHNAP